MLNLKTISPFQFHFTIMAELKNDRRKLSDLNLLGSPKGRVVPAKEIVQYQSDTCGLRQQAAQ